MSNPYNLTNEQMAAYSAQIADERAARAAMPGGAIRELRQWMRVFFAQERITADQVKLGTPGLQSKE